MKSKKQAIKTGKIADSVGFSKTAGTIRKLTAKEKRQQKANLKTGNLS